MIYLIIIFTCMALIAIANILFNNAIDPWYWSVLYTLYFTVLVVLIDGLVAFAIRKLPEKYFDFHKKIFIMGKKEKKFFEAIGIKKWKEKVPELGSFTDFHKNKIAEPRNNEYLKRFMLEACYGEIIHYASFFASFLVILFDFKMYGGTSNIFLTIALPVAVVNAILIVLPGFILKYNLEKLRILYQFNNRHNSQI